MSDGFPLTVPAILRHAAALHSDVELAVYDHGGVRRCSYADVAARVDRLTGALLESRVVRGHRVGTLLWNTQPHLEAYLGVPAAGAILHTINVRLQPDHIARIIDAAQDSVLLIDASLWEGLGEVLRDRPTVRRIVVTGDLDLQAAQSSVRAEVVAYEEFLAAARPISGEIADESAPAVMCFTSGTTGTPKGVVYSHRSVYLHALVNLTAAGFGIGDHDRVLQVVPMFHANGWGFPYAAWLAGAGLILPGRDLRPEVLVPLIAAERPTVSAGVPTVWRSVFDHAREHPADLSSLRAISCAGSAVPESLLRDYRSLGIDLVQAWGMTETSPLAVIARPPAVDRGHEEWYWRTRTGRPVPGVEIRAVDISGTVLVPGDPTVGEIEVRGPWVTRTYLDGPGDHFRDGWLRTGDLGTIDDAGAMKISDRLKDLIKSGGEWISSTELEDRLHDHPAVADAAVIGVPDEKWGERPLAVVVLTDSTAGPADLRDHLAPHVARWQLPDYWVQVPSLPRTPAGKIDKQRLRADYAAGALRATTLRA